MKLKRIVEQQEASQFYDLGKDFFSFTHAMDATTEQVKNRFEQAIAAKIKGKKIRARASRGYKQFEKDYEINAANVSIDDYYDNYVVVVKSTNGKEYFLKPGFKVQVIGPMDAEKPEPQQPPESQQPTPPQSPTGQQAPAAQAPAAEPPAAEPSQTPSPAPAEPAPEQPAPQPPAAAPTAPKAAPQQPEPAPEQEEEPPKKQAVKESVTAERTIKYTVDQILEDVKGWLPQLLANSNADLRSYIPRDGVSRTDGNKTTTIFGLTIPVDEVPGLQVDQLKHALSSASRMQSSVCNCDKFYTLEKFDTRGSKYVIIIKKITSL